MKKNIIIIGLIFILPMVAYALLSESESVSAAKHVEGKPQVIKFSSKLCIDCKKMKTVFEQSIPEYYNKIEFIEYDVQSSDKKVQEEINNYNITLVPTIIYINNAGKEVRRTEGYVEKKKFDKYLNELLR